MAYLVHQSTSICAPNFIEIGNTFCGQTYGPTDGRIFPSLMLLGQLGGVDLKMQCTLQLPITNKNSSGDEIANVNFYAVRPEGTRIR